MASRAARRAWQLGRKRVPIVCWLPKYNVRRDLKFDVIAGFTVCVMLVPQEMSLAALMGVPAQYGLYSAAIAPLIYPIFGSSRAASVANTSEAGLLIGVMLRSTEIKSMDERVATGILMAFFSGALMIVSGFTHQGGVVTFFSRTAMNAYVTAMACLTITSQIPAWLGISLTSPRLSVFSYIEICALLPHVNLYSLALGVFSGALLLAFKGAKRRLQSSIVAPLPPQAVTPAAANDEDNSDSDEDISADGKRRPNEFDDRNGQLRASNNDSARLLGGPSTVGPLRRELLADSRVQFLLQLICDAGSLIVCIIGMMVGRYLGEERLRLTGAVHQGLPSTVFPLAALGDTIPLERAQTIVTDSFMVAVVIFMSSVAMGENLANKQGYHISPNQELLGLGFANLVSSFFQGMPSSTSMSRSVVNSQTAHTPLASMITALLVMFTLAFLTAPLYYLPLAPLAVIIIVSSVHMVSFAEPKWLFHVRRREFYVWVAAFGSTVCLGLLYGLVISVSASLIEIMERTKKPRVVTLGEGADGQWLPMRGDTATATAATLAEPLDLVVVRMDQSLYFGNASHLVHAIERRLEAATERGRLLGVVVDGARINDVDASSIHVLKDYEVKLQRTTQQEITFCNLRAETAQVLVACGFSGLDEDADSAAADSDVAKHKRAAHDFTRDVASAVAFLRREQ